MDGSFKVKVENKSGLVTVRMMLSHPMESGRRKGQDGKLVPAHYIETLTCDKGATNLLTAFWGPAIAKDPYLSFQFRNAKPGEQITLRWVDNLGMQGEKNIVI